MLAYFTLKNAVRWSWIRKGNVVAAQDIWYPIIVVESPLIVRRGKKFKVGFYKQIINLVTKVFCFLSYVYRNETHFAYLNRKGVIRNRITSFSFFTFLVCFVNKRRNHFHQFVFFIVCVTKREVTKFFRVEKKNIETMEKEAKMKIL